MSDGNLRPAEIATSIFSSELNENTRNDSHNIGGEVRAAQLEGTESLGGASEMVENDLADLKVYEDDDLELEDSTNFLYGKLIVLGYKVGHSFI